jgi:hypothetical protein
VRSPAVALVSLNEARSGWPSDLTAIVVTEATSTNIRPAI